MNYHVLDKLINYMSLGHSIFPLTHSIFSLLNSYWIAVFFLRKLITNAQTAPNSATTTPIKKMIR